MDDLDTSDEEEYSQRARTKWDKKKEAREVSSRSAPCRCPIADSAAGCG